jgi:hypothetical protein
MTGTPVQPRLLLYFTAALAFAGASLVIAGLLLLPEALRYRHRSGEGSMLFWQRCRSWPAARRCCRPPAWRGGRERDALIATEVLVLGRSWLGGLPDSRLGIHHHRRADHLGGRAEG